MTFDPVKFISELYPFNYSVVSDDCDSAIEIYLSKLDFEIHSYPSGSDVNGWLVPNNWKVLKAEIYKDDTLIYDGLSHPMGVGVLSPSFCGKLSLADLKKHLFYSDTQPDGIPYHWVNLYRPQSKDWAFCVTKSFFDDLIDGDYFVNLVTHEVPGSMKVLDYVLPGKSDETILINAHNCHPWQANDDISGCSVGVGLIKKLIKKQNRYYTYRLIIAPELIGTVHWLNENEQSARKIKAAILLKSVGNKSKLKLQKSFSGQSVIDKLALSVLDNNKIIYHADEFRRIYGNDETVFDSPGFNIPTISFTRYPFDQYHTSKDSPEFIDRSSIEETLEILEKICESYEVANISPKFIKKGLICLSQAKYNLYKPAYSPGVDRNAYTDLLKKWNLLMNCLPMEMNGSNTVLDISVKYGLPVIDVYLYIFDWKSKGLVEF